MIQARKGNKIQNKSNAFKITAYKFEASLFLTALLYFCSAYFNYNCAQRL